MRIIAGDYRRRLLASPSGMTTRPMPDRVKESLFSMLGTRVVGAQVLDLFAGSGAIGLEAVSRGAAGCLLVEMDKRSHATLESNIRLLMAEGKCKAIRGDALGLSLLARCPRPTDLIFMDPPYPLVQTPEGWQRVVMQAAALVQLLAPDGFLILRTPWPHMIEPTQTDMTQQTGEPVPRKFKRHSKPRIHDVLHGEGPVGKGKPGKGVTASRVDGAGRADRGAEAPPDSDEGVFDGGLDDGGPAPDGALDLSEMIELTPSEIEVAMRYARRTPRPGVEREGAPDQEHDVGRDLERDEARDARVNAATDGEHGGKHGSSGGGGGGASPPGGQAGGHSGAPSSAPSGEQKSVHRDHGGGAWSGGVGGRKGARGAKGGPGSGGDDDADDVPPTALAYPAESAIPGARGPETHRYGSMAVHFYMKA